MKILHIGQSYPFVSYAISSLNIQLPADIVAYVSPPGDRSRSFAVPQERARVELWPTNKAQKQIRAIELGREADIIVAHELSGTAAIAIAANPDAVAVWSGWGTDYYHDAFSNRELLGPLTRRVASKATAVTVLRKLALRRLRSHAARHIELFCAPIPSDERVMRRALPALRGSLTQMPYLELGTTMEASSVNGGPDILVGNSATPTCNHLEVFELLRHHDLSGRRVIVPLTYGEKKYREAVIQEGSQMLGPRFVPIENHLPEDDYYKIMDRCGTAIFNHRRQQAMGNIIVALQKGMNVYLDDNNPAAAWLRANGLKIYSTSDLIAASPQNRLTEHDRECNVKAIRDIWGHDAVFAKYTEVANQIRLLSEQRSA